MTFSITITKRERNSDIIRPEYTFHNMSGTLGALYDVGYHLTFGLSATSAWRAPGANELFSDGVHHGSASYERGNRNLVAEQAYNLEASVNYYANQRLNGKLTVYNNVINDYIYLAPVQPATLTIRGAFPTFEYKQANAIFRGIDLDLEYRFTPQLYLESKTSIVRAINLGLDDHLVGVPADRYNNMLRYEPGVVADSDDLALQPDRQGRAHAAHRLVDRAVHAAVDDAVRLHQLVGDLQLGHDLPLGRLDHEQPERPVQWTRVTDPFDHHPQKLSSAEMPVNGPVPRLGPGSPGRGPAGTRG
jgi:hypothetical protein